jgi:hypothetical protein
MWMAVVEDGFISVAGVPTRSMARAVEQEDDLVLLPDEQFVKSWLFANQTDLHWPKKVCVLHVGQQLFCAARKTLVEARAEPGETVSISLAMRAPAIAGEHVGYWRLAEHDSEAGFGERARVRVTVLPREACASADEADEELLRKLAAMGMKDVVTDKRGARAALRRNNFHVDRTIADLLGGSASTEDEMMSWFGAVAAFAASLVASAWCEFDIATSQQRVLVILDALDVKRTHAAYFKDLACTKKRERERKKKKKKRKFIILFFFLLFFQCVALGYRADV